jgi:hypothetical protein
LLKKANLPKEPEKRIKVLEEVQFQALKFLREKEVEVSGQDPDPLGLGKSEDGKENVYELYVKCKNCGKVFRTFKNSEFCGSVCRYNWVKKNMIPEKPLIQEIFAEREGENWDWVPVGNREGVTIYRRVFKEGEKKQ